MTDDCHELRQNVYNARTVLGVTVTLTRPALF
jgi:hypothetical protein